MKNKKNIIPIKSEIQLTAKALKTMAKNGIGHSKLANIAKDLTKKKK
jgi:hypothetical protein